MTCAPAPVSDPSLEYCDDRTWASRSHTYHALHRRNKQWMFPRRTCRWGLRQRLEAEAVADHPARPPYALAGLRHLLPLSCARVRSRSGARWPGRSHVNLLDFASAARMQSARMRCTSLTGAVRAQEFGGLCIYRGHNLQALLCKMVACTSGWLSARALPASAETITSCVKAVPRPTLASVVSQPHKPQPKHALCLSQLLSRQVALPLLHLSRKPPQPPCCRASIQCAFTAPSWTLSCC